MTELTRLDMELDYLSNSLFTQDLYLKLRKAGILPTPTEIEKMHNNREFDVLDLEQPDYRKKLNREIKRMRDSIKYTKESIKELVESGKENDSYEEWREESMYEMQNR